MEGWSNLPGERKGVPIHIEGCSANPHPHHFGELDPDNEKSSPYRSRKLDPHQSLISE